MFDLFMAKYEAKLTKMETHSYGSTFTTFLKRIINASRTHKFSTLYFKTSTQNIFIFLVMKVAVLNTRSVTDAPTLFSMLKKTGLVYTWKHMSSKQHVKHSVQTRTKLCSTLETTIHMDLI